MRTIHAGVSAGTPHDDGTVAVLLHVLMNRLAVISMASRTLLEQWDALGDATRDQLLIRIDDTVGEGIDRLEFLYRTLAAPLPSRRLEAEALGA